MIDLTLGLYFDLSYNVKFRKLKEMISPSCQINVIFSKSLKVWQLLFVSCLGWKISIMYCCQATERHFYIKPTRK